MKSQTSENRVGVIYLSENVFAKWEEMLPIMGNFVPVRAEWHYMLNCLRLECYSPLFEINPAGHYPPEYELEISFFPHAPVVIKATKLPDGHHARSFSF